MDDFNRIAWTLWVGTLSFLGINALHLLINYLDNKTSFKPPPKKYDIQELLNLKQQIMQDRLMIHQGLDELHQQTLALVKRAPVKVHINNAAVHSFLRLSAQYPKGHFDRHTRIDEIIKYQNQLMDFHHQVMIAYQSVLTLRHEDNQIISEKLEHHQLLKQGLH